MPSIFYEAHPRTQAAIKAIVLAIDRGEQPSDDMNLLPAVDYEYIETDEWDEGSGPEWYLTPKGLAAAIRWRGDDGHGGKAV
jgi:hypothetical protein